MRVMMKGLAHYPGALVFLQEWKSVLTGAWDHLTREYKFGTFKGSVATLFVGGLIFGAAYFLSRMLSQVLQRRISKRAYLDPGLRYTLGRLTQYLIMATGVLFALSFGVGLDLTSIAVLLTALSVGIGFGLQYIAADIASGFILLFERPVRVGDRITIGEDEGDVQSIAFRSSCRIQSWSASVSSTGLMEIHARALPSQSALLAVRMSSWSPTLY
jgi:small-conductance mechanosensitive channel